MKVTLLVAVDPNVGVILSYESTDEGRLESILQVHLVNDDSSDEGIRIDQECPGIGIWVWEGEIIEDHLRYKSYRSEGKWRGPTSEEMRRFLIKNEQQIKRAQEWLVSVGEGEGEGDA